MKLIHIVLHSFASISLVCIVSFLSVLFPSALFAIDEDFTPAVSEVVMSFSAKYCAALSNGGEPEKAAEVASRQMISGLVFSGVLKEVMSVPKDDMASFVASEIFDECGQDLSITQQDLNDYLVELADSGEAQRHSQPHSLILDRK